MEKQSIPVQTALMPLYYKEFRCIGGACQDNCCDDGWRIAFNKKDYLKLKRAPMDQNLRKQMEKTVIRFREQSDDKRYAEIKLDSRGMCPFHGEDGLCQLQVECGEDVLPRVCRIFPRSSAITPAGKEYSLSPACEAVLDCLWDLPQGVDFWEEPLPKNEWVTCNVRSPMAFRFPEIRSLCIDVLQERSLRLSQRFLLLGVLLRQLIKLDWERIESADVWLAQGEALLHGQTLAADLDKLSGNKQMFLTHNHGVLTQLIVTSQQDKRDRKVMVYQLSKALKMDIPGKEKKTILDVSRYRELEKNLLEKFPEFDKYFFENLMVCVAFHIQFPYVGSPEDMWKSYVQLCSLYSLCRFAVVCGSAQDLSRMQLFRSLVCISRSVLHSPVRRDKLLDELFQHNSATLAHMAILVNG